MNKDRMFCYQCEQTAKGKGCEIQGVCGKKASTANIQDELINSAVNLSINNIDSKREEITELIIDSLFTTITNVNFKDESIKKLIDKIKVYEEGEEREDKFNIEEELWKNDNEDIKSLKSIILFGIKGIAAYAHHARVLGYKDGEVDEFFYRGLKSLKEELPEEELLKIVLKTGEINLKCMELLDKANTERYGNPKPTKVSTNIEAGPFIVVTGHDLRDLELLLKQTEGRGVNIYTHGEMLPCQGYPELKKYKHLKGNYGTAWQNQQKEFENIPAPILFTTNCIMPVKESYADRVYTTSVVEYPSMIHIGEDKNFEPIIEKAIELGGYKDEKKMTGINGGDVLTVGFGHNTVLSIADKIIDAIKSKKINRIFLVGGCDGAKVGRNYYTEFVKKAPKDSIILTLACGKYRFNDIDLGKIDGIERLIDIGQCNDAYSAIKIAVELTKAFGLTSVNQLPLYFILSWYEQKAVSILLTLLYLGIKNIKIGPSLPAFISPNVLKILEEKYQIKAITTAEEDLREILKDD